MSNTNDDNNGINLLCDGMNNQKLKKTIKLNRAHIVTFSLPAVDTCPGADKCLKGGYCHAGNYRFKSNVDKQSINYAISQSDRFVDMVCTELADKWTYSRYVRIHPTGDFYSMDYFKKWVAIAIRNPGVIFYAYTKSIDIIQEFKKADKIPVNMFITYSYGSKYDDMINPTTDYHAVVIGPNDNIPTGYVDGSIDDLVMCKGNKRIALKYHHPHIKFEDSGFIEIVNPF